MAGPQHATLVAGEVTELTFNRDFDQVEVTNVDGAGRVYFRVDKHDPGIEAEGSEVIPAAVGSLVVDVYTAGDTVVRLISDGTPKVSVRGL